jgi:hypothetical protein
MPRGLDGRGDFMERMIEGNLPPRAISLVLEWAFLHRDELLTEWELASKYEPLFWIKPME